MQKPPVVAAVSWPLIDIPVLEHARGEHRLVLAGRRMLATASAQHGVHDVIAHPNRICFSTLTCPAPAIERTAAGLSRQIRIENAGISENVAVAINDPAVVWCWRAEIDTDARFAWSLKLERSAEAHTDESSLRLVSESSTLLLAFSQPVKWTVTPIDESGTRVSAELHLPAGRDVWLTLLAADVGESVDALPGRGLDPSRIPLARAAAFRRRTRDLIQITTPDPSLPRTIAGLIDRVQTSLIELPRGAAPIAEPPGPGQAARIVTDDACVIAEAAAAIGDNTLPRATLRFLNAVRESDQHIPAVCSSNGTCSEPDPSATAAWLSLAARYHAWSGDDALLRELWPDLENLARKLDPSRFGHTLRSLAITAESLGHAAAASDFRRATASPEPRRQLMAANTRAAQHLLKLLYDQLGFDPDAARGRLRARLKTTPRIQDIRIDNVRVGDARISIHLTDQPHHTRIVATQTAGPVPIRLILEPMLRRVPSGISIDERSADLDLHASRTRIIAPVQIELDHARTIDFHFQT